MECKTVGDLYSWLHARIQEDPAFTLSKIKASDTMTVGISPDGEMSIELQRKSGGHSFLDFDADIISSGRL